MAVPSPTPPMVPLSSIDDEGQMILPEFWAEIGEERVFVTAVLERTVVFEAGAEKKLTRRENCYVDPADIQMRPVTAVTWRGRGKPTPPRAPAADTVAKETGGEAPGA
ncbi:MAG: hypothetical protein ACREPA_03970 [Candidatus Dormibacteraceae bacterium]